MRTTGRNLVRNLGGEDVLTFVPLPLPPCDPPLLVAGKRAALLARAEQALARREVAGEMVPSLDWFIYAFVRKEAVMSSQIEGTQASGKQRDRTFAYERYLAKLRSGTELDERWRGSRPAWVLRTPRAFSTTPRQPVEAPSGGFVPRAS